MHLELIAGGAATARTQARQALQDLPLALADAQAARCLEPGNAVVVDLVYSLEDALEDAALDSLSAPPPPRGVLPPAEGEAERPAHAEAHVSFARSGAHVGLNNNAAAPTSHRPCVRPCVLCHVAKLPLAQNAVARRS